MKINTLYWIIALTLATTNAHSAIIAKSLTTSKLVFNEGETITATVSVTSSYSGGGEGFEQLGGSVDFIDTAPEYGQILEDHVGSAVVTITTTTSNSPPLRDDGYFRVSFSGYVSERKWVSEIGALVGGYTTNFTIDDGLYITVNNIAPTITDVQPSVSINLNDSHLLGFGAWATDPGIDDVLTYAWDLNGDGNFTDASGFSTGLLDFDGWSPAIYAAKLRVDDGDGGVTYQSFNVTVLPEPGSALMLCVGTAIACSRRRRGVI